MAKHKLLNIPTRVDSVAAHYFQIKFYELSIDQSLMLKSKIFQAVIQNQIVESVIFTQPNDPHSDKLTLVRSVFGSKKSKVYFQIGRSKKLVLRGTSVSHKTISRILGCLEEEFPMLNYSATLKTVWRGLDDLKSSKKLKTSESKNPESNKKSTGKSLKKKASSDSTSQE
jgi:hypothetical protein